MKDLIRTLWRGNLFDRVLLEIASAIELPLCLAMAETTRLCERPHRLCERFTEVRLKREAISCAVEEIASAENHNLIASRGNFSVIASALLPQKPKRGNLIVC